MLNITNTLRSVDDMLARASSQLADGATPASARHLVARSIREIEAVRATPLTFGPANQTAKSIQLLATDRLFSAYTGIAAGDAAFAQSGIDSARFAIDLLLPG